MGEVRNGNRYSNQTHSTVSPGLAWTLIQSVSWTRVGDTVVHSAMKG
jgi:hypothetical protein